MNSSTLTVNKYREVLTVHRNTTHKEAPEKQHTKELKVASHLARTLRESLTDEMSTICESYLNNRLAAKFKSVAKMEGGKAGARPIYLSKHGQSLQGFEFNSLAPYRQVFKAKYFIQPGSRRGQVILHFPAFVPEKSLSYPAEATNFKISARLVALSDFGYDTFDNSYKTISKEYHGKCAAFDSGKLPILKMPIDSITAQLCVDQKAVSQGTSLFLVMSVSFYHFDNGRYQHLSKASTMQICQVF